MKHLLLLVRILFESKPFEHFPFSLDNNINVITIRGEEKLETEGSQTNAREYLGFPVAVALPRTRLSNPQPMRIEPNMMKPTGTSRLP
jgi:hypothetical protein